MQPQTPARGEQPPEEEFPFGYRLRERTLPDGTTELERVAYTVEDVLHPEPDDVFPVRPEHAIDCTYLYDVFRVRGPAELASQPIVYVSYDHLVDWGVPEQRNTSPDVAVFGGLNQEVDRKEGTFNLKASGGRCLLVVEVVSPDRRRENDVVHKVREYYNAGVPLYVIVDQEREDAPRHVRGLRHRPNGWEELSNDDQGRLLIEPLNLWLGLKDGRVACYDVRTGRELGDYERLSQEREELTQELEEADRRIAEQEKAIEQAVEDTREQRQACEAAERAREAAEKQATEQQQAREAAEQQAREQAQAREEAERQQRLQVEAREAAERAREAADKRASEQQQAREAAEERIRQLEQALRALQPPS
jgi:hypothetical protein